MCTWDCYRCEYMPTVLASHTQATVTGCLQSEHLWLLYHAGSFNDVFAFFISPVNSTSKPTNIALLPGSNTPVSIGTVNQQSGSNTYYVANHPTGGTLATSINGMTQMLNTSTYNITAGTTYRIKLVIADSKFATL